MKVYETVNMKCHYAKETERTKLGTEAGNRDSQTVWSLR